MLTDIRQHYYYFKSKSKNVLIAVFEDSHFDSTCSKCRIFAVTVTSRVTAGQQENLCAQVHGPTEPVKLLVSLEMSSSSTVILEESVPVVSSRTVASVNVTVQGATESMNKKSKIVILPPDFIHIVQTDKPIYKPGQTGRYMMDRTPFFKLNILSDPADNRIAQWLDKPIGSGILDLSHPMIPEAAEGQYRITATTDRGEEITHTFEIKEYVLPKYEVKVYLPNVVSILEPEATVKICAKKPRGLLCFLIAFASHISVCICSSWKKMAVPHTFYTSLNFLFQIAFQTTLKSVLKYQRMVQVGGRTPVTAFVYQRMVQVGGRPHASDCICSQEPSTISYFSLFPAGVTLKGSATTSVTHILRTASFEDLVATYKPGIPFEGKVFSCTSDLFFLRSPEMYKLITDAKGFASFSLNTSLWNGHIQLKVVENQSEHSPEYRHALTYILPFYSKSSSFVKLVQIKEELSCGQDATLHVQYIIKGEELKAGQEVLDFFYLVSNKGEFTIQLKEVTKLAPFAQVVVYTVMPSGEAVADSQDYPVGLCLNNKVSLKFSSAQSLPAEKTTLSLQAQPGSMCSVRAIDQSVLLLKAEQELSVQHVRQPTSLPINEDSDGPIAMAYDMMPETNVMNAVIPIRKKKETVRTFFPETWIWDLIPVGDSGAVNVEKTVPDTITKWAAGAFCVSSVGLGISPNTGLTAFQPFFVSLTLPYSVIRGEVFTLKATVFNYLSQCIMVNVRLADSSQFTSRNCDGCQYTVCLCDQESKTFSWIVTPTDLGEVKVKVSAEAMKTNELCGNEVVTVPEVGQIDTVVRPLLVEVCFCSCVVSEGPAEKHISLQLPEVFVAGSARASVSVLGDLMGRAMKNLDKLLAMPYGCGEQNMVLFAPNIFILNYLKSTGQLTQQIQDKATRFLESGRNFFFGDLFGFYCDQTLTAFVMKSFGGARPYIFIDPRHIAEARSWLSMHQDPDGCIHSVGRLLHNGMKGGVSDDVSLTAYIIAAMLELNDSITDPVVGRGLMCLKAAANKQMDNLYTTALLSYTFTLAGDEEMRSKLITYLNQASKFESKTGEPKGASEKGLDSLEVEMTSYMLLALHSGPALSNFGLDYSSSIVRWLAQQQNPYGGFSSTQVRHTTLAKYGASTYSEGGQTTVTVTSAGGLNKEFLVDQSNRLLYQSEKLSETPGEYTVRAEGQSCVMAQTGQMMITVIHSHTDPVSVCVCVCRYQGSRDETNMVIINIKLLSGYILEKSSLGLVSADVTHKTVCNQNMIHSVTLEENIPVRNLKPAVVKIYDYYQTSDEATTEYNSPCAESKFSITLYTLAFTQTL
uniref:Alpha-2-macroglobulin-like 1 n=1 Tax=Cynoglossus semilaevis TaxID=244447 RepID=A0A3P8V0X2_CYNSE